MQYSLWFLPLPAPPVSPLVLSLLAWGLLLPPATGTILIKVSLWRVTLVFIGVIISDPFKETNQNIDTYYPQKLLHCVFSTGPTKECEEKSENVDIFLPFSGLDVIKKKKESKKCLLFFFLWVFTKHPNFYCVGIWVLAQNFVPVSERSIFLWGTPKKLT